MFTEENENRRSIDKMVNYSKQRINKEDELNFSNISQVNNHQVDS